MDGASNADGSGNVRGAGTTYSGAETIEEFQVITNNNSARYKSAAAAIISAVTKSGTNDLQGSVFWTHRYDAMKAATFFDNALGLEKPAHRQNQFGFSLDGPMVRDRTFFFASYEGLKETTGITETARVSSLGLRQGSLAAGRAVPINPLVLPFVNLWSQPTPENTVEVFPEDDTLPIAGERREPIEVNFFALKIDHELGSAGSVRGTYSFERGERSPCGVLREVAGNPCAKDIRGEFKYTQHAHV